MLFSILFAHPIYDSIFLLSALLTGAGAMYFRKQTILMKKQLGLATEDSDAKAKIAETLQGRVNDEIMGYPAAPGILSKMGLTERVFLLDQKATALDKKTDLQNLVINDVAKTVKQLLPNGGTSLADKIDKMGEVLVENSIQLASNAERMLDHLATSETVKQELSDRVSHIETLLQNPSERPRGTS